MNQICVLSVDHLPQFFSWFILLSALTNTVVLFWQTVFLTRCCWWRWGRWQRRSISIHDGPNLQIFRNPERNPEIKGALAHSHKRCDDVPVHETSAKGVKFNSVVWSRRGSGPSRGPHDAKNRKWHCQMLQMSGQRVWLMVPCSKGLPSLCVSYFLYHSESLGLSAGPLSVFTVTRGKNLSVHDWAQLSLMRNFLASNGSRHARFGCD